MPASKKSSETQGRMRDSEEAKRLDQTNPIFDEI
jgi:hypothetical protein